MTSSKLAFELPPQAGEVGAAPVPQSMEQTHMGKVKKGKGKGKGGKGKY